MSQEDAGRALGQEDGHRVVVSLAEEFAAWWSMTSLTSRPSDALFVVFPEAHRAHRVPRFHSPLPGALERRRRK